MDMTFLTEQSRDSQLAYAAGIFNGEGHVGFSYQKRKSGIDYPSPRLTITQWYSTEILDQFKYIFGFGTVEGNLPDVSYAFRYRLQSFQDIKSCVEQMWPWLSEQKRRDAEKTIKAYEEYLELKAEAGRTCKNGHDMKENEFFNSKGARQCRTCARVNSKRYRDRKRLDRLYSPS